MSTESYGIDPLFRPPVQGAGEETMYDGDLFDRMDQFYNTTSGAPDVKATGVPFAFFHRKVRGLLRTSSLSGAPAKTWCLLIHAEASLDRY